MRRLGFEKLARAAVAVLLAVWAHAENKVERSPLQIGTALDIGQVVSGVNMVDSTDPIRGMMIQQTAVYLNQRTTIDDRLVITVGVGGLFFYGFPEIKTNAQSRSIRFGPGVGQASGLYKFGDVDQPALEVEFGYFPYKYNPDARNLGEFLFRSGAYPGYQITGGWSIINSAMYTASGLSARANLFGNTLRADFNMFLEHGLEPIYDLSPGLVLTYKPSEMFEAGVGAAFAHLIPVNPSKLDSRSYSYRGDSLYGYLGDNRTEKDTLSAHYSFKGTKLMARASLNLGAMFDNSFLGTRGLKLYGEASLLGVNNYPYFYEDRMARLPIVVGMNLPSFNFFDILGVEMEYRKRDFPNSTKQLADGNEAVWRIPDVQILDTTGRATGNPDVVRRASDPHLYHPNRSQAEAAIAAQRFIDSYDPGTMTGGVGYQGVLVDPAQTVPSKEGNLKWTVYAKKQLVTGIFAYLQVASDHMRAIRFEDNTLDREIITQTPEHWYYLFRLEFGI